MPIYVDHDERRDQIMDAAIAILGEGGFKQLTLRAVGNRLGGSVTLVTHYFPTREELLHAMLERTLEDARSMQDQLVAIEDPHERLRAVIRYFLPLDDSELAIETARVALASAHQSEPAIQAHYAAIEPVMRELVRRSITDLLPQDRIEPVIDLIRVWTGGMVLSVIEHPEMWPPERQIEALQDFLEVTDLPVAVSA